MRELEETYYKRTAERKKQYRNRLNSSRKHMQELENNIKTVEHDFQRREDERQIVENENRTIHEQSIKKTHLDCENLRV